MCIRDRLNKLVELVGQDNIQIETV
jgi:hypothetical protein